MRSTTNIQQATETVQESKHAVKFTNDNSTPNVISSKKQDWPSAINLHENNLYKM